jgi:hypothetical protein
MYKRFQKKSKIKYRARRKASFIVSGRVFEVAKIFFG